MSTSTGGESGLVKNFQVPTPLEPIFGRFCLKGEVVPVTFPFLPLDIFETGIEIIVNTSSGKVVLRTKNRWLADRTAGWGWKGLEAFGKEKTTSNNLRFFQVLQVEVSTETRVKKTHIAPTHVYT